MHLADGMTSDHQRSGFLVIHSHPPERGTDLLGGLEDVGIAFRPFGIDVDQAHFRGGERAVEVFALNVALRSQELGFRPPIDQLWLPRVSAATGKAEGCEAGVFQRHVACQDDEVRPRKRRAVLLLHRPQYAASLVEVAVVWPRIERFKADLPAVRTPAPVTRTIGACRVPGEADEQPGIIAVIGRPPLLRICQCSVDVGLHRLQIELGEFGCVIEIRAVRVGVVFVLAQAVKVDHVGPPALHVARRSFRLRHRRAAHAGLVEPRRRGRRRQGKHQAGGQEQQPLHFANHLWPRYGLLIITHRETLSEPLFWSGSDACRGHIRRRAKREKRLVAITVMRCVDDPHGLSLDFCQGWKFPNRPRS